MASARRNTAASKNWETYQTNSQAWDVFLLSHPDAATLHSRKEFNTWAKNHPQYAVDLSLWDAKEVRDAGYLHHNTQEQTEGQTTPAGAEHAQRAFQSTFGTAFGLPFLAIQKELMQDDDDYLHLVEEKRNEWRKNNKTKVGSQEEIDYVYGALDEKGKSALDREAEESFRQKHTRNQKKIDRYERNKKKIYSRFDKKTKKEVFRLGDDPAIKHQVKKILAETDARFALAEKNREATTKEEIQKRIEKARWEAFVRDHPEKAAAYGTHNSEIGKNINAANDELVRQELEAYQQTTAGIGTPGREIKYVEKKKSSQMSVEEASQRLAEAERQREAQKQSQQRPAPTQNVQVQTQRRQKGPSLQHRALDRLSGGQYSDAKRRVNQALNRTLNQATRGLSSRLGQRMRPFTRGFGAANNALNMARDPRGAVQNYLQNRALGAAGKALAQRAAQFLGGQALAAIGGVTLGSVGWIALIILLVILAIILLVIIVGCSGLIPDFKTDCSVIKESPASNSVPGLSIRKTGPAAVENGATIEYSISVTYNGPLNVVIEDTIPANTEFVSSTGTFSRTGNTITWPIKSNKLEPSRGLYLFNFTVKPLSNDIIVTNKAVAKAFNDLTINPNASDITSLMKGHGRNVGVMGSEDAFTQRVMQNGTGFGLSDKEANIRAIYKKAVERNINPLAIMVIWGTEVGFKLNNSEFSCPPRVFDGFTDQLSCSTNTFNNWMKYFEENKDKQTGTLVIESKIGKTCIYDDPFLYALEKYGPVCAVYDSNDHFHTNFVKFYKQFLGSN